MGWTYVDIFLILVILASAFYGWRRGFILGLLDLVRWLVSLLAGLRFYQSVARFLQLFLDWSEVWLLPLAFLLTATAAGLLIQVLGYRLLRRLPKDIHRRRYNRLLGILPGLLNGLILAAIMASLLLALPLSDGLHRSARQSLLVNHFSTATERLESSLSPIFDEAISRTFNMLTIRPEPESGESVKLPFKVADTEPRPDLEARMLEMVNAERVSAGLEPLAPDPELTEVARRHSADMFARGYFSHSTPEGRSPFDRIREARVTFRTAGENLALAPTLSVAHTGLMNSPGHRANILRPQFGRVGIGILDGGFRGLMVTQNFRD
ncbi:MAG TPA: CvpA family protein [Blastocatellia bacterium]|nr:CvpA family protein [Blastocatellia bacterium]